MTPLADSVVSLTTILANSGSATFKTFRQIKMTVLERPFENGTLRRASSKSATCNAHLADPTLLANRIYGAALPSYSAKPPAPPSA